MVMLMGDDSQVLGRGDDNSRGRSSTGSYPSQDAYEELVAGNLHFAKLWERQAIKVKTDVFIETKSRVDVLDFGSNS